MNWRKLTILRDVIELHNTSILSEDKFSTNKILLQVHRTYLAFNISVTTQ